MTIKTKALSLPDASIIAGIVLLLAFLIIIISMPSLTIGTLKHWDREAMLMLNDSQGAWMDQFWYAFSSFKTWIVAMIFIAITIWNTCKGTTRQKLLFMLCFVLLFVMLDQISSSLIKPWVARLRPSQTRSSARCSIMSMDIMVDVTDSSAGMPPTSRDWSLGSASSTNNTWHASVLSSSDSPFAFHASISVSTTPVILSVAPFWASSSPA